MASRLRIELEDWNFPYTKQLVFRDYRLQSLQPTELKSIHDKINTKASWQDRSFEHHICPYCEWESQTYGRCDECTYKIRRGQDLMRFDNYSSGSLVNINHLHPVVRDVVKSQIRK